MISNFDDHQPENISWSKCSSQSQIMWQTNHHHQHIFKQKHTNTGAKSFHLFKMDMGHISQLSKNVQYTYRCCYFHIPFNHNNFKYNFYQKLIW